MKNYFKCAIELMNTNIGKIIIEKYQQEGNNLRNLEKEFNCNRFVIREMLKFKNIPIKKSKEARNEVTKVKHLYGKNHWRYGKVSEGSGHTHWYLYKGNKFQGSWEFKFGLWLESSGKTFKCHKDIQKFEYEIDGNQHTYSPDFYIFEDNKFVEVKGYFTKEAKKKMQNVVKLNPNFNFEIFDKTKMIEFDIFNIDKKLNIYIEDFELNSNFKIIYENFVNNMNKEQLLKEYIIDKLNLTKLAKKYNIPMNVMNKVFKEYIPKIATKEWNEFRENYFFKFAIKIKEMFEQGKELKIIKKELSIPKSEFHKILKLLKLRRKKNQKINNIKNDQQKQVINTHTQKIYKIINESGQKIKQDFYAGNSKQTLCLKYLVSKKQLNVILNFLKLEQKKYYVIKRHLEHYSRKYGSIIKQMYDQGISLKKISSKFKRSEQRIQEVLDYYLNNFYQPIIQ
jgi:hypothetical protein